MKIAKITVVFVLILSGCRSPEASLGSDVLDVESGCGGEIPVSTDEQNGEDIFELTSRCVFNRSIHTVHIRILSETFAKVLDDGCADRDSGYGHVIELELDGHKIKDVGIRVRGNTSRCNDKRQFRLKFDEDKMFSVFQGRENIVEVPDNDDRRFFGLEGFSLRSSGNDPSMIRERLSAKIFTQAEALQPSVVRGSMVYRVAFTKVFVSFSRRHGEGEEGTFNRLHGDYWYDYKGFYNLTENIDKVFLESRLQVDDEKIRGTLLQADKAQAYLHHDRYNRVGWDAKLVDGKKAKKESQFAVADQMVADLIDLLDSSPSESELSQKIDISNVVGYFAASQLVGHWDSLVANRNNDFLYFNDKIGKWQVITWDLDNSFGVIYDQYRQLMSSDIFSPASRHKSKLFEKIFASDHPNFRRQLQTVMTQLIDGYYSEENMRQAIETLEYQVRDNIEPWEGYRMQHYVDLKNFVQARHGRVRQQL